MEAVKLPNNEWKSVTTLLRNNISIRFGTQRAIIRDEGSHFYNRLFSTPIKKYGVKYRVAHPIILTKLGKLRSIVMRSSPFWQKQWMAIEHTVARKLDDVL